MAEKVNLDNNAVDWNDYGVSVEGQPQVNVRGGQETPDWFDYEAYRKAQGKEGDWSAPEMKNPDTLTKIRSALARVKEAPEVLGYAAHKVADPMFANVDYMGQQVGDWASKKINNVARAFDISPEARQYGRFEEEEYDPEAVDVRFGKNAYKEGYDNLGDYLEAKDQEAVDRYRGYNHADRFAPIENADDKFYTLSDTQTMEDWQPETTSGKVAKGAITTAGDMLPENLKALMEEKGIEGGAKMLGALAPAYVKMKEKYLRSKSPDVDSLSAARAGAEYEGEKLYRTIGKQQAEITKQKAKLNADLRKNLEQIKSQLTPEEYQALLRDEVEGVSLNNVLRGEAEELEKVRRAVGDRVGSDVVGGLDNASMKSIKRNTENSGVNGRELRKLWDKRRQAQADYERTRAFELYPNEREEAYQKFDDINRQIGELTKSNTPKPLPNPAAQRAEAMAKNARPTFDELYPDGGGVQAAKEFIDLNYPNSASELKTGAFNFGGDKKAINRFIKQLEENNVRYALRNTDAGMVVDVLSDSETMPYFTEAYRNLLKIK